MLRKKWTMLFFCLTIMMALFSCSNEGVQEGGGEVTETSGGGEIIEDVIEEESTNDSNEGESLTLPEHFPADFPLPDNITITEIDDDSDESKYSFGIRFNFDPNIDMDATFEMYDEYARNLDYNIIIGGEEYFADGIFQFGATSKMSASDMFVVTLKPEGTTFGDIQVKVSK